MPEPWIIEETPNPNSRKISFPGQSIGADRGRTYTPASPPPAGEHPLADRLLNVPGVKSLFVLKDFITVTKDDAADWGTVLAALEGALHAGR